MTKKTDWCTLEVIVVRTVSKRHSLAAGAALEPRSSCNWCEAGSLTVPPKPHPTFGILRHELLLSHHRQASCLLIVQTGVYTRDKFRDKTLELSQLSAVFRATTAHNIKLVLHLRYKVFNVYEVHGVSINHQSKLANQILCAKPVFLQNQCPTISLPESQKAAKAAETAGDWAPNHSIIWPYTILSHYCATTSKERQFAHLLFQFCIEFVVQWQLLMQSQRPRQTCQSRLHFISVIAWTWKRLRLSKQTFWS